MQDSERLRLRDKAKSMFQHAYDNYMTHAYPADELMPVSCRGRYRGSEPSRGDIDDCLGNYSLTLIDSLDTLLLLNEPEQFEYAVRLVVDNVRFNTDVVVSVFEANIRVVGGLLGGHVGSLVLKHRFGRMSWYSDQLLSMALWIWATGFCRHSTPALAFPILGLRRQHAILEFAALSRFSGNPEFELRARRALDALWSQRNLHSNLVGTVINIHNGDWVRKESGIGAGIDSYYEYLNFMDALAAFWPGLQVMTGDLKPAVELHEILYQVVQRYNFIPEAFTPDFHVHWAHHPLRPEFIESTYFLYKATRDPHYLEVGKRVIDNLEKYSRTECGYAAISDVRTMEKSDQLDSFVLAETFKYLYLLFANDSDLPVDLDAYVFTTEAHLLPLELANLAIKPPESAEIIKQHILNGYLLVQVVQRYNFIPEAFTPDFHVHWAHHPLRPEFIESTYFLYKATRDPHYLEKYSRTECGYAAISDVRTMEKSDQLDSFVLAETFKYLYLLFANDSDLPVDLDAYVFTTEAHLLPLELANLAIKPPESAAPSASTSRRQPQQQQAALLSVMNDSCPNYNLRRRLFGADDTAFHWRRRLQLKPSVAPGAAIPDASQQKSVLPFDPRELDANNPEQQAALVSMGIATVRTGSGQLQLFHNPDNAESPELGRVGLAFMQAMINLAAMTVNKNEQMQHPPNYLYCPIPASSKDSFNATILGSTETQVGPSQFGPPMSVTGESHLGYLLWPSRPGGIDGCTLESLDPLPRLSASRPMPWLLVLRRGGCLFVQKARNAEAVGAAGVIIADNQPVDLTGASLGSEQVLFAMSSDGGPNVTLPAVFTFSRDARNLLDLALFFSGPAPIVLAGRKLSHERLSEHWESVQGLLDGQYSGLTVSHSVYT
uniref:alpha-1,2-Mannosidase n=1 Tax=Macrostomum lignano TaxID=282301 RepID=A0A1I8HT13_9PLAT